MKYTIKIEDNWHLRNTESNL